MPVTGRQPGERAPAPAPLELVQAFVNTIDREDGDEALDSPESLSGWLVERELIEPGDHVGPADLDDARALRESLRAILLHNNGGPIPSEAVGIFNAIARGAHLRLVADDAGDLHVGPACWGAQRAWGELLAIVARATADGSWARLKACREHACHWAFYDHSRNGSSQWCTMEICGSRAKMRRYRSRRAAAG